MGIKTHVLFNAWYKFFSTLYLFMNSDEYEKIVESNLDINKHKFHNNRTPNFGDIKRDSYKGNITYSFGKYLDHKTGKVFHSEKWNNYEDALYRNTGGDATKIYFHPSLVISQLMSLINTIFQIYFTRNGSIEENNIKISLAERLNNFKNILDLIDNNTSGGSCIEYHISNIAFRLEEYSNKNNTSFKIHVDENIGFEQNLLEGNGWLPTLRKYICYLSTRNHNHIDVEHKVKKIFRNQVQMVNELKYFDEKTNDILRRIPFHQKKKYIPPRTPIDAYKEIINNSSIVNYILGSLELWDKQFTLEQRDIDRFVNEENIKLFEKYRNSILENQDKWNIGNKKEQVKNALTENEKLETFTKYFIEDYKVGDKIYYSPEVIQMFLFIMNMKEDCDDDLIYPKINSDTSDLDVYGRIFTHRKDINDCSSLKFLDFDQDSDQRKLIDRKKNNFEYKTKKNIPPNWEKEFPKPKKEKNEGALDFLKRNQKWQKDIGEAKKNFKKYSEKYEPMIKIKDGEFEYHPDDNEMRNHCKNEFEKYMEGLKKKPKRKKKEEKKKRR